MKVGYLCLRSSDRKNKIMPLSIISLLFTDRDHGTQLKMDNRSQETLRRVQQNDDTLTELYIGNFSPTYDEQPFNSNDGRDYSRLGACIGENTRLTKLVVVLS